MVNKFIFNKECTLNGIKIYKNNEYSIDSSTKEAVVKDGCFTVCRVDTALRNKLGYVVERPF